MTRPQDTKKSLERFLPPPEVLTENSKVPMFRGEYDQKGVYVYQAFCPEIADWALEHQTFGGPAWKPVRMTWIKPSFAWMLYRSGYGKKGGQRRILKIKISHETIAHLLSHCKLVDTNKDTKKKSKQTDKSGDGNGRVQWDPERDLFRANGKEPRRMLRQRAIQIGLAGSLSEYYVDNIISIQEVTDLAHRVGAAHELKKEEDVESAMEAMLPELPDEQPYLPMSPERKLQELAMLPGPAAEIVAQIGQGKAH